MANRNDPFFSRLTSLFRSGPAIQRKVKGYDYKNYYDNQLARGNNGHRGPFPFGRESSPFSVLGSYGILDRMARYSEFCFAPETLVYTTKGVLTIKELAEKYSNGERFEVYSYDHNKKEIVIGTAHDPRLARDGIIQDLIKITLDDGGVITTTLDHKFMKRDGTYEEAVNLKVGEALMPLYVKDVTASGYQHVYTVNRENNKYGWSREHVLVAENIIGRKLLDNEVVHHIDFNPSNNRPENLKVMDASEHQRYHTTLNNKNKFGKSNNKHSQWMKNNNPCKRSDITFARIFDVANSLDFSLAKTKQFLDVDGNVIGRRLREHGFSNWLEFKDAKEILSKIRTASFVLEEMRSPEIEDILTKTAGCKTIYDASAILHCTTGAIRRRLSAHKYGTWSEFKEKYLKTGNKFVQSQTSKDSAFDETLTYQDICSIYESGMTAEELANKLNTTINKVKTRIEREGYDSFGTWKLSYENHKIASVECLSEKRQVYNLTVDNHHNVAVGSLLEIPILSKDGKSTSRTHSMVICRQSEMEYTPEIAASLNIFADECSAGDEKGKAFHLYSKNPEVKKALEELFYDILNIDFNIRPWVRNLPIHKDTPVPLLDGRNITIEQVAKEHLEGKENWVYSVQDKTNQLVAGKVNWCGITKTDSAILRIVLDDNTYVDCTPEHQWILRDGSRKQASELQENDSLMPFYRTVSIKGQNKDQLDGYEKVYNPAKDKFEYTHRIVADDQKLHIKITSGRKVVHHCDFNKLNNTPGNLLEMDSVEHFNMHGKHCKETWHTPEVTAKRMAGIDKWLRSDKHRNLARIQLKNRQDLGLMPTSFDAYNNSALHTEHNEMRSVMKTEFWKDQEKKLQARERMTIKFDQVCLNMILEEVKDKYVGVKQLLSTLRNKPAFINHFISINETSKRDVTKALNSNCRFQSLLRKMGYDSYLILIKKNLPEIASSTSFKKALNASVQRAGTVPAGFLAHPPARRLNHKVVSIQKLETRSDVYCMEVLGTSGDPSDRHNFMVLGRNISDGEPNASSGICSTNCKYGDFFLYNEVVPDIGIINVQPIPVNELEREDGFDQNDPYAIRYKWLTRGNRYLENWQVTHMRVLGNDLFLPYGTSLLEPARRVWRQLCVRRGTPIWIDGVGYKSIEDVKPGDVVQTYDLENNKIVKAPVKGCYPMGKQSLVRIKTSHRTIDVTSNHGMLVKTNKGEMVFKEAKDLICSNGKGGKTHRNADKLVLPSGNFETNEKNYTVQMESRLYSKAGRYSHSCNDAIILSDSNGNRTFITSTDFMRFFGFMHGDGWVRANTIGFALGVYEEQNKYYIELFENIFKGLNLRRADAVGSKSSQVNVTSTELCHLFRDKLGFKTGFANKRIPSWVFSLDQENKVAFLKGLFDADGSDNDGRISLANKALIEDVKMLAQQAGVSVGGVKNDKKAGEYYFNEYNKSIGKKSIRKDSYRLYINFNKINKTDMLFEAVNRVETLPKQDETYDLEVNHSSHNFCANGVISHNTMMEDSMLLYRVVRSPERRVFYIDVGNIAPNDVPSYMEAAKETLKSKNQLDKATGQMDSRYNPMDIESDYFIPVRGGQTGTKIETLPGGTNATAVEDVKYLQSKMFAALQVPKAFLNFDENLCVTGETYISLLSGRPKTIKELAIEFDLAKQNNSSLPENYAYSATNKGKIIPGKIIDAWKTKEVSETCKVTLDNGEAIESTLSHPFMLRDGTYLRANELKEGMSLMPLYRKTSSKKAGQKLEGYEMIQDNEKQKWVYTHRMVHDSLTLETHPSSLTEDISVVHHKNFDKTNNNPSNLINQGRRYHRQMHIEGSIANLVCEENRDRLRGLWNAPGSALRTAHKQGIIEAWADVEQASKRRKAIADTNRACGKIDIMKKKLKEIQMSKIPTYEQLCEYVVSNTNASVYITKLHYGCSLPQLREIIKKAGHNNWFDFYKSIHPKQLLRSGYTNQALQNKTPKDFISIANECKSIEQFCNKLFVRRNNYKKFLYNNGEDYVTWFKTNLRRHSKSIGKFYNHKVVSVEIIKHEQPIPVYDLTIENAEGTHNFALGAGVFVHNSAKASLAQQDVRFSRTISVLQRVIISELNKMAMVHLYSKGFDGEDLIAFELRLSNPSTVAMQQKLEALSTKFDIAGKAKETLLVDEDWIQRKIIELTEDEIIKIESGRRRDKVRSVEIEAVAVAENLPQKNTVTDPFDPSGYVMPGEDVKKNPPVGGSTLVTDIPTNQTNDIQNAAAAGVAIAGNPGAKAKSPTSGVPISANPFTSKQRHNDRRLVGMGGRDNLQNPNFADMLSATNKHMSDINDKHSLVKLSETTLDKIETTDINLDEFRPPPVITSEMVQLKRKLDAHFAKTGGRKKKIIITENDVNLSKLDDEDDGRLYELTMSDDDVIVEASNKSDNQELSDDLLDELKNL